MAKITIIGLGLIGGSLGLALRQQGGGYEVVGHDRDPEASGRAKKRGAVDRAEWNLPKAVEGANLVVVATPPGDVAKVFQDIGPYLAEGAVVTDTASTKVQILDWANRILPTGVSFVGGHPMAGKERNGIDEAEATLFQGSTYCVVPANNATDQAISLVTGLVSAVGAQPLFIDPVEHDSFVAAISHLPYLAATALVKVAAGSPAWRDIAKVAATGFRDTTRVASASPVMYRDICLTNREAILRWLDAYMEEMARLRDLLITSDGAELESVLTQAKTARDEWQAGREGAPKRAALPGGNANDQLRQMLMGSWGGGRDPRKK
ncbi:MAG: prephenate dehydrogenase [Chloroflexota bacterium]